MEQYAEFFTTWREAASIRKKMNSSNIPYSLRQLPGKSNLLFVFPKVSISQYVYLHIIFGTKAGGAKR
ncbi:hypothetical protein [Brevibacillus panacihumi]|uniref:Uncharacterized protein n=1 Tax=Brevibacillus panacihumi TaxID=497735 RepID=A0A3M8DEJ1_9BACL|nr:hypothetical protein [Brevibacillus panacihumi]RNB85991.1 hypothetical protein EDM58_00075 [Brevibacillus panacihumi]